MASLPLLYINIEMRYFRLGRKNKYAQFFNVSAQMQVRMCLAQLAVGLAKNCLKCIQITRFDANGAG